MDNKIVKIQESILREIDRLDNDEYMQENGKQEVARSNALSSEAIAYIKLVNLNINLDNIAEKQNKTKEEIEKKYGV